MARPRLPGWPLEAVGNGGPREMITGSGNGASQNPAYRPSPVFRNPWRLFEFARDVVVSQFRRFPVKTYLFQVELQQEGDGRLSV